jgi:signal peptidase I
VTLAQIRHIASTALLNGAVLLCLLAAVGVGFARYSGYELMSVQSNSMSPVMHKGDAVLLNKHKSDPKLGDIISFVSPNNTKVVITHRVVGIDNHQGMVETRGDNASLDDQPIPAWNILGTVVTIAPVAGNLLNLMKNPLTLIVIIYLPALGIVISEINRLSAYYAITCCIRVRPLSYYNFYRIVKGWGI